jgi:hypothetical protein
MNLQRLKEYKEAYGTVAVLSVHCRDGRFEGLNLFLNYWRRRVESCRKVKNCKAAANIRQLIDLGVDFEAPTPPSLAFESKLQLLKEYKEVVYGTMNVVLTKHCNNKGKFQGLNCFLSNWRSKARRFDQGEETTKKAEANIRKLIDLGVVLKTPPSIG